MKNEINYLKVVIMSLVLTLFSVSANAQQKKHNYITTNEQLAEELSEKYGNRSIWAALSALPKSIRSNCAGG